MVDEGRELGDALQRAARESGQRVDRIDLPLAALRTAIGDYRKLFRPEQQGVLNRQRRLALEAMKSFANFSPRLTGALVHGDGPLDSIRLMLNADTPEQVLMALSDRHIPWREAEVALSFAGARRDVRPAFRFLAGDTTVELIVLSPVDRSNPPRDPLDGGPLTLLDVDQLRALIDSD